MSSVLDKLIVKYCEQEMFQVKKIIIAMLMILLSFTAASAQEIQRPRVLTNRQGIDEAIERTNTNPTVAKWYDKIFKQANNYLKAELISDSMDGNDDMMYEARKLKERVLTLGFVYFKSGEEIYAERACDEVLTACTFDWGYNISFLGVAEMAFGVALGYDWLYDKFSEEELSVIENALMEKAITPYYEAASSGIWWSTSKSNWNIVCNGGVLTAVLALDEKAGNIGAEAMNIGMENIKYMMPLFAPDGAWEEGLMYWRYTTEYFVNFVSSLVCATGSDCGMCSWEGVDETGYYPFYMSGAGGGFSYSDTDIRRENPPQIFWLADWFGDDGLAAMRIKWMQEYNQSPEVRDILWYSGNTAEPQMPPDKCFGRVEAFSFRDTYENTDGIFFAAKGGQIGISHSHFDAGSFVLDALGERFITDLGREEYSINVDDRYQLYRNRAEGHNTLVINPSPMYDQNRDIVSKITRFESADRAAYAVVDLTPAYKDAAKIQRGYFFDRGRKSILIQDEIKLDRESDIWWFAHTPAEITLVDSGKSAILDISGKRMRADIIGDNDYVFQIMDAKPMETSLNVDAQNPNTGIQKLAININGVHSAVIKVVFTAAGEEYSRLFSEFIPIDQWQLEGKLYITDCAEVLCPGQSFCFGARLITAESSAAAAAEWRLEDEYEGVSIDAKSGRLDISRTAAAGEVTVCCRYGEEKRTATVKISPVMVKIDSMPLSVLPPSEGTDLTLIPKYTVCYENGIQINDKSAYSIEWRLASEVEGVSINSDTGHIRIGSNVTAGFAEIECVLNECTAVTKRLYFGKKSLTSEQVGAIAWNYSGFGGNPGRVIDGDQKTYIDTGVHSAGADTRFYIKLGDEPVSYNKVRITIEHTENTRAYMLNASDILSGEAPEKTTVYKADAPYLSPGYAPGGQTLYKSEAAPESTQLLIRLPEISSRYMVFENTAVGKGEIRNFMLNEIEVYNSTAGDAQISADMSDAELVRCSVDVLDTEGDALEADGVWSLDKEYMGISINSSGEITVEKWADIQDITVIYTLTGSSSQVIASKTLTVGFVETMLMSGGVKANSIEKGKTYNVSQNCYRSEDMTVAALYHITESEKRLSNVYMINGQIDVTIPDGDGEYELRVLRWDRNTITPYGTGEKYTSVSGAPD